MKTLAALLFATSLVAQIQQTVLSIPVSAGEIEVANPGASKTGDILYIDNEAMMIIGIQANQFAVWRGMFATLAASHSTSAPVYIGDKQFFLVSDPSGYCNADPTARYINVRNTAQWQCIANTWSTYVGGGGGGSPAVVTIAGTTPTQAIFAMPSAATSCTVEVSESNTYAPLVNDVDPTQFTGAGTYTANASHYYVVGKRTVEATLSNGLQSRALQNSTTHYWRATCAGMTAATGAFATLPPAMGSTFFEPTPDVPLFNVNDRNEIKIDALTGLAARKLSKITDHTLTTPGVVFQNAAFPVALSTTKTFFPADHATNFVPPIAYLRSDRDANLYTLNYFQGVFTLGANSVTVNACLTYDATTCAANGTTYAGTSGATSISFGSTNPGDLWQQAGNPIYPGWLAAKQAGVPVFGILAWTASGTASVTAATYNVQLGTFPFFTFTGASDICSANTVTGPEGTQGYNCALQQNGGLFWVDQASGKAHLWGHYLNTTGIASADGCGKSDGIIFDPTNADVYYCGGSTNTLSANHLWQFTYHGTHAEPPVGTYTPNGGFEEGHGLDPCNGGITNTPCTTSLDMTAGTDIHTLAAAYDATFQKDRFQVLDLVSIEDGKLIFRTVRSNEYSLGWTIVYDPAPGVRAIVGMLPSWQKPGNRWCGLKGNEPVNYPGWLTFSPYYPAYGGLSGAGHGPWVVDISGSTSATCPSGVTGTCSTITVSGEPYDLNPCTASAGACSGAVESTTPGELQNAAVNDELTLNGTGDGTSERFLLVQKTDPTHWIVKRAINGVTTAPTGRFWMACNTNGDPMNGNSGGGDYWNYASDPHGNALVRDTYSVGAHLFYQHATQAVGYTPDVRCTPGTFGRSCYGVRTWTSIPDMVSHAAQGIVTLSPTFAGKYGPADGNQVQQHPTGPGLNATTAQQGYWFDARPFQGSPLATNWTNVSGNLWKATAANIPTLDRKFLPTLALAGVTRLTDVSGPGSAISALNTYCVALLANECTAGSAPGDAFLVAANVTRNYCWAPGQASGLPANETDLCLGNNSMVYNTVMQNPVGVVDVVGAHVRALTHGFVTPRVQYAFDHSHSLANGNWLIYMPHRLNGAYDQALLLKVPPVPTADAVDRTTFVSTPIALGASAGADNALVEFGYAEFGGTCTSRVEACRVGVAAAAPFYFATTEAGSLTGVSCVSGCTVSVPAISQHVLQYRPIYRSGTTTVNTGAWNVVAIP
jgi:hypothetical protein